MSFSSDTKNELTHDRAERRCCRIAEIAGFIHAKGRIFAQGRDGFGIAVTTENPAAARYLKTLLAESLGVSANLIVRKSGFGSGGRAYELRIRPGKDAERAFAEIGGHSLPLERDAANGNDASRSGSRAEGISRAQSKRIGDKKCCRKAYLKGVFLGAGTVSEPEKSYNLEVVCRDESFAHAIRRLTNGFTGMRARVRKRRDGVVVYLKSAEQIKDMLNIIGAHTQLLKFESAMVLKDVRNRTNRINNCDHANLDRSLAAAAAQLANIDLLRAENRLDELPGRLPDLVSARLARPEASLSELGELLDPPLGKSAVCAGFKQIAAFANAPHLFTI
ncbi:MAG: DNA-binding protein WhiA [Clostridiales Family XIII bacterium]|nr:DNA-binding protein WhiA [Clostridiales Family XIII bacterium]